MLFCNQKASRPELFTQSVTYKDQVIEDLFLNMLIAVSKKQTLSITLGQFIKFSNEKYWYEVKAISKDYIYCYRQYGEDGFYTILDLNTGFRGSGTSWGLGHETDEQFIESMLAMYGRHPDDIDQEISRRNRVPLEIEALKCEKNLHIAWFKIIQKMDNGIINFNGWYSNIGLDITEKNNVFILSKGHASKDILAEDYTIGKFETMDEAKEEAQKYFFDNYKTIPVLNWEKDKTEA